MHKWPVIIDHCLNARPVSSKGMSLEIVSSNECCRITRMPPRDLHVATAIIHR